MTRTVRSALFASALGLLVITGSTGIGEAQASSDIVAVVNNVPITRNDVSRRTAFLKLQRTKGNLAQLAKEQLVNEQLERAEIARVGASVSTDDVDKAFERFSASNKLSTSQMSQILEKSGVGVAHFKNYIAIQMSWPRVVNGRFGGSGLTNDELIKRMHDSPTRPQTTEYFLKTVIFVVPSDDKNKGRRKAEAEKARSSFPGCEQAKVFAAKFKDVSVKDVGRLMAPQLPEEWKPLIEKAKGNTTGTRVTEKGVEFVAICSQRQVSDDAAAEMVFRAEDIGKLKKGGPDPNEQKYLAELRKKAMIDLNPK